MSGMIPIRGPPSIDPRLWWGGRGPMPRGHTIALRRKRDEVEDSSTIFRYSEGKRMILIVGWRILGYGVTRGDNWSHPSSNSCGEY